MLHAKACGILFYYFAQNCFLSPTRRLIFVLGWQRNAAIYLHSTPNAFDGLVVDLFAGAGASEGLAQALERAPDIAINHDSEALAIHKVILVLWDRECAPCAGTGAVALFFVWAAYAAGMRLPARIDACAAAGGVGRACPLGWVFCCPAGTGAFSLFVIWAACAAGGEGAC